MSQDLNMDLSEQFSSDLSSAMDTVFAQSAPADGGETSPAPSPEPDAAVAAPDSPVVPETPAAATALSDDTPIEVLVNGQPVIKTLKQLKSEGMMHSAFTQKTQALAEQRRQVEAERAVAQQERQEALRLQAQLRSIAQDKAALSALYLKLHGQDSPVPEQEGAPQATPAFNPDQMADFLTPRVQERVMQEIAAQQERAATLADVETFTNGLIAGDPVLTALGPKFADTIYSEVAALQPSDAQEAKEFIRLQVEATKAAIQKVTGNTAKAAAVAKAQAADAVQRGGSPVLPQKKEYESFKDMSSDMEAYLTQLTTR